MSWYHNCYIYWCVPRPYPSYFMGLVGVKPTLEIMVEAGAECKSLQGAGPGPLNSPVTGPAQLRPFICVLPPLPYLSPVVSLY